MESRDNNRNFKLRDPKIKAKEEKEKKEEIKILMNKIVFINEFPIYMIKCYISQEFRPLSVNELVSILKSDPNLKNDPKIRKKVGDSLNVNIFQKKNYKFDLDLEKTVQYLTKYLNSNSPSKSNVSNNTNKLSLERITIGVSPVMNFPEQENDIAYLSKDDESQQKLDAVENVEDTCFTFGEQSQIKIYKANRQDEETLKKLNANEIKALNKNNISADELNELKRIAFEKNIPNFNSIFDKNNYLENLSKDVKEFFKSYQEDIDNNKKKELFNLEKDIKEKKNSFNELSSLFNEEKEGLSLLINAIQNQFKIISKGKKINDICIPDEKEIVELYIKKFKDLFSQLQDNYEKIKEQEMKINEIIYEIKKILKDIWDKFSAFRQVAKNILDSESISIKVYINETVKLCYYYINEFDNNLIEMKSKK